MSPEGTAHHNDHEPRVGGVAGAVRHAIFGFFMGAADTVPGVSGGTIAFVCGIYERLLTAISDGAGLAGTVVRGRFSRLGAEIKALDWAFIVPLGLGIVVAVGSLASVIEHLLEEQPVRLSGLFMGLVLGSVIVSWRLLRRPDARTLVITVVAAIATFLLLGLRTTTEASGPEVADAPLWAYPLAGAIAICAMILPGVSGSFLLVTMDMYNDVLGAVSDRDVVIIALFGAGCIVGLGLFSRLLRWLLAHHHDVVVAALIGLMIGSMRVLWPWPGGTATTELAAPGDDVVVPVALGLVGLVVVIGLGFIGQVGAEVAEEEEEEMPHPLDE